MKNIWAIIKAIIYSAPAAIFTGLVIISIGLGALMPAVNTVAYPLLTGEGEKIALETYNYSYKPGQAGTVLQHFRTDRQGNKRDVTLRVVVYSGLIYAVLLLMSTLIASAISIRFFSMPVISFPSRSFAVSLVICVAVSLAVMVYSLGFFALILIRAFLAAW